MNYLIFIYKVYILINIISHSTEDKNSTEIFHSLINDTTHENKSFPGTSFPQLQNKLNKEIPDSLNVDGTQSKARKGVKLPPIEMNKITENKKLMKNIENIDNNSPLDKMTFPEILKEMLTTIAPLVDGKSKSDSNMDKSIPDRKAIPVVSVDVKSKSDNNVDVSISDKVTIHGVSVDGKTKLDSNIDESIQNKKAISAVSVDINSKPVSNMVKQMKQIKPVILPNKAELNGMNNLNTETHVDHKIISAVDIGTDVPAESTLFNNGNLNHARQSSSFNETITQSVPKQTESIEPTVNDLADVTTEINNKTDPDSNESTEIEESRPSNEDIFYENKLISTSTAKVENNLTFTTKQMKLSPVPVAETDESTTRHVEDPQNASEQTNNSIIWLSVTTILLFCSIIALLMYKRIKAGWNRRHYKRVDFLIDGMYDDL